MVDPNCWGRLLSEKITEPDDCRRKEQIKEVLFKAVGNLMPAEKDSAKGSCNVAW